MFADVPAFNAWFPEPDGFPRPDWKAIGEFIKSHSTEEQWAAGWQEMVRVWLDKFAGRLGGVYAVAESENFHLLSELDEKERQQSLKFLEQARAYILRALPGIPLPKWYGKHVVLRFTSESQFFQYTVYFYPEADPVGTGGQFIARGGYMHIAYPHKDSLGVDRHTLARALTRNLLCGLHLPIWLGQALSMLFARDIAGSQCGDQLLTGDLADAHRAYWNAQTIQQFWDGTAFRDGDANTLADGLARILFDFIVTDVHPAPADFRDFVLHADREDAGQAAAHEYIGVELSDLAATFLGPGEWRPSRTTAR